MWRASEKVFCVVALGAATATACTQLSAGTDRDMTALGGDGGTARDSGVADSSVHPASDASDAGSKEDVILGSGVCKPLEQRTPVTLTTDIITDTTWSCDNIYTLGGVIFVRPGAVLTITPGTVIRSAGANALCVTRGARIEASGTAADPILFTSAKPVGSRKTADWGGLILLGAATTNSPVTTNTIEGVPNANGLFGGTDDDHNCGTLRHVRMEFTGAQVGGEDVAALTVGACGRSTTIDHVQAHNAEGDGLNLVGGTANVKYFIGTGIKGQTLDWDLGYRGSVQFFIGQQHAVTSKDGVKGASNTSEDLQPRSAPTLSNMTLIGALNGGGAQPAFVIRRGSFMSARNTIIMNWPGPAIVVESDRSRQGYATTPPALNLEYGIIYQVGARAANAYFSDSAPLPDGGTSAPDFFTRTERRNSLGLNPRLPAPDAVIAPNFLPPSTSPTTSGTPPLNAGDAGGFFDESASFIGAIHPGGPDWTLGWTSYPEN